VSPRRSAEEKAVIRWKHAFRGQRLYDLRRAVVCCWKHLARLSLSSGEDLGYQVAYFQPENRVKPLFLPPIADGVKLVAISELWASEKLLSQQESCQKKRARCPKTFSVLIAKIRGKV